MLLFPFGTFCSEQKHLPVTVPFMEDGTYRRVGAGGDEPGLVKTRSDSQPAPKEELQSQLSAAIMSPVLKQGLLKTITYAFCSFCTKALESFHSGTADGAICCTLKWRGEMKNIHTQGK